MINPMMKLAAIALTATAVAASTAVAQVKLHQPVVRSGKIRRGVDERAQGGARKGRHGQYFRVMRPQNPRSGNAGFFFRGIDLWPANHESGHRLILQNVCTQACI
jgi:hypothetical protein